MSFGLVSRSIFIHNICINKTSIYITKVNLFGFLEDKKRFLIEAVRQNPDIWQSSRGPNSEQQFNEIAVKLGTTSIECLRYFSLLKSEYIRQKKKLDSGKKIKNHRPILEELEFMDCSLHITTKIPSLKVMEVSPTKSITKVNDGSYDNDAFTSGSSEDEEEFPTQSHAVLPVPMNPRKRPHSPRLTNKVSTYRKAGEYMIAELENMDHEKAELLLNKTLKFFVEHRYD